jgi:hypothetical protein
MIDILLALERATEKNYLMIECLDLNKLYAIKIKRNESKKKLKFKVMLSVAS